MLYKECTTGFVICMYRIYSERKCIDGEFMNALRRFKTIKLYIYIMASCLKWLNCRLDLSLVTYRCACTVCLTLLMSVVRRPYLTV